LTRVLDPLERSSEVLFGVIMVLTFTGSISVAEGGQAETRTVLAGAIGCNLAWGIVDGAIYLMASFIENARGQMMLRAVREAGDNDDAAHRLIRATLPPVVSAALTAPEIESLHRRIRQQPEMAARVPLSRHNLLGAVAVFLLVFASTFPIVIPFFVVSEAATALRVSNLIAIAMLFVTGWSLGSHAGRPGLRSGLFMVTVGLVLMAITMALGG
jgi:hypothetical protein